MSDDEQLRSFEVSDEEENVAVGGVQYPRAGCLLLPILPIRAAGLMIVSTKKVVFDPILHYKLFTRRVTIDFDDISEAEATGGRVELSVLDIVNIGKRLTLKLKDGKELKFRSTAADMLASAINLVLEQRRG